MISYVHGVLRGVVVITLGLHPRNPGFDSRAEWKSLGGFSYTPCPCSPSSEWVPGVIRGLWPVSWAWHLLLHHGCRILFTFSPPLLLRHMTLDVAPPVPNQFFQSICLFHSLTTWEEYRQVTPSSNYFCFSHTVQGDHQWEDPGGVAAEARPRLPAIQTLPDEIHQQVEAFGRDRMAEEVTRLRELMALLENTCNFVRKGATELKGKQRPFSHKVGAYYGVEFDVWTENRGG